MAAASGLGAAIARECQRVQNVGSQQAAGPQQIVSAVVPRSLNERPRRLARPGKRRRCEALESESFVVCPRRAQRFPHKTPTKSTNCDARKCSLEYTLRPRFTFVRGATLHARRKTTSGPRCGANLRERVDVSRSTSESPGVLGFSVDRLIVSPYQYLIRRTS